MNPSAFWWMNCQNCKCIYDQIRILQQLLLCWFWLSFLVLNCYIKLHSGSLKYAARFEVHSTSTTRILPLNTLCCYVTQWRTIREKKSCLILLHHFNRFIDSINHVFSYTSHCFLWPRVWTAIFPFVQNLRRFSWSYFFIIFFFSHTSNLYNNVFYKNSKKIQSKQGLIFFNKKSKILKFKI